MKRKGILLHSVLAAGAAIALLTGCGQENKPEEEASNSESLDPLSLPLGDRQPEKPKYNTNIPPLDELKKQYLADEERRKKEREPKWRYASKKLYEPFTVYPKDAVHLPQLPKSKVFFARAPQSDTAPKVVVLTTTDAADKIEAYYADKLKNEGWVPVRMKGNTAYHEVVAVKGKEQITVTIYIDVYKDERVIRIETRPKRA